jgi:nucleotide-binding universal stress UspA family protein
MDGSAAMKILVGYVPTAEGEAALDVAAAEAELRGGSVVLVNTGRGDAYIDRHYANQAELDAAEGRLRARGVEVTVRHGVGGGDAAAELLKAVAEEEADLIVLGIRRRTPVGKFILGSTARRILLESPVPVLAVKVHRDE